MPASFSRRKFLGGVAAALAVGPQLLSQDKPATPPPVSDNSFNPDTLFLTWQQDPTTTMTIQWIGKSADDPVILYANRGKDVWQYGPMAEKTRYPFIEYQFWPGAHGPTDQYVFRAELTGLTPGTEYEFKIGLSSPTYRFRTMPAKATKTFSFVSGGDCGVGPHTTANNKIAARQDPMFALIGGDLAYDNGLSGATFFEFIRSYSKTMIDTQGRLIPMVTCVGNHEVRGGYGKTLKEATFFNALFGGFFKETSYRTLDFGDYLSLVLLDTGHAAPIAGEQTAWLDKALGERAGRPHLMAVNHVPCYPSYRVPEGKIGIFGTGEAQRKNWVPLFEKHNVDIVLEHHDHTFKRTHPLKGGVVDDKTGIVYLGDGSWGKLRIPKPAEHRPYLADVSAAYHLTLHRLEGEKRFHLALDEFGKVLDITMTGKKPRNRVPG